MRLPVADLQLHYEISGIRKRGSARKTLGSRAQRVHALDSRRGFFFLIIKNNSGIRANLKRGKALLQVLDKRSLFD